MANWYIGSTKYTAVAQWQANHAYSVGDICRQLAAPAVNDERCFRCTTAGNSHATTEPTWNKNKGATTAEGPDTLVWTECTGNSSWGWTAPHARLYTALNWGAAGDTFYVSNNHAETQDVTVTLTDPGTYTTPCFVLCVDDSATPPTTLATTATINSQHHSMYVRGHSYYYGIAFITGSGTDSYLELGVCSQGSNSMIFDYCTFTIGTSHYSTRICFGGGGNTLTRLVHSTFGLGGSGQVIRCYDRVILEYCTYSGTSPTYLFYNITNNPNVTLLGCDFSSIGAGCYLVDNTDGAPSIYAFRNCKLGAGVTLVRGAFAADGFGVVTADNCDSGDTNYKMDHRKFAGSIVTETTIVRTGGASDGTTPISHKMVSLSGSRYTLPLEGPYITLWNEAIGSSMTATIEFLHDSVTKLKDNEIWLEVEYLGTSGFPLSLLSQDRMSDIMSTPADQATSVVAWNTGAMANPNKQKMVATFTPQEKGPIRLKVMLAKASYTVYYCPKVDVA